MIRAGWLAHAALLAMTVTAITAVEAAPQPEYLSDHPELIISSTQGFGSLEFDVAAGGSLPLQIGEKHFDKGLGHHANGTIIVRSDGQYESFDAEVGLQPCAGGTVIFRVIVDGQQRFNSGLMRSGDQPKSVHVPVSGAQEIRLEAGDAGDGINCDMANWAEARLTPQFKCRKASPCRTLCGYGPIRARSNLGPSAQ